VNEVYEAEHLDVQRWLQRFEADNREVYREREMILAAVGVQAGQDVADVGAGTGIFALPFAAAVGPEGTVYAVDIAPDFLDLIRRRAAEQGLENVVTVQADARSCGLEAGSVDAIFLCDTYHHLEYPAVYLASLHAALRPGGQLFLVEFRRKGDGPRGAWMLRHVRADQAQVTAEIEAAGFHLEEEIPGLEENYMLRFRRD